MMNNELGIPQDPKRPKKTGKEFSNTTSIVSKKLNQQNSEEFSAAIPVAIKLEKNEELILKPEDTRTYILNNLIKYIIQLQGNFASEEGKIEECYQVINYYLGQKDLKIDYNEPTDTVHYLSAIESGCQIILKNPSLLQLFIASTGSVKNFNVIPNTRLSKKIGINITNLLKIMIKPNTKLDVNLKVEIDKKEYSFGLLELAYMVRNDVACEFLKEKKVRTDVNKLLLLALKVHKNLQNAATFVSNRRAKVDAELYKLTKEIYEKFQEETKDKLKIEATTNHYNTVAASYANYVYQDQIPSLQAENQKLKEELQQLQTEKQRDQEITELRIS